MAIIRQRKRNLALAMVIGIVAGALPFGVFGIRAYAGADKMKKELLELKDEISGREHGYMYMLKTDKKKGEEIHGTDLLKCEIYSDNDISVMSSAEDLVGKKLKIDMGKMSIIDSKMVYEEEVCDDVRLHEYSFLNLHDGIVEGSYVDIRIAFPNGEDYIVAEHKRVEQRRDSSVCIYVNEEEILLMSSAQVDINEYAGTRVYAILYARDYQSPANKDYPANAHVSELADWDPNIIKKVFSEEGRIKRTALENNLTEFLETD